MNDAILKDFLVLLGIVAKQDGGLTSAHIDYVNKYLLSLLGKDEKNLSDDDMASVKANIDVFTSAEPTLNEKEEVDITAVCSRIEESIKEYSQKHGDASEDKIKLSLLLVAFEMFHFPIEFDDRDMGKMKGRFAILHSLFPNFLHSNTSKKKDDQGSVPWWKEQLKAAAGISYLELNIQLMLLFGLVAKQDDGASEDERNYVEGFLRSQIEYEHIHWFMDMFDFSAEIKFDSEGNIVPPQASADKRNANVSVKVTKACRTLNESLKGDEVEIRKQQMVILVRLYEMLCVSINATTNKDMPGRKEFLDGVAENFNVPNEERPAIKNFSLISDPYLKERKGSDSEEYMPMDCSGILVADQKSDEEAGYSNALHIQTGKLRGAVFFLYVRSVQLYFVRFTGGESYVNGNLIATGRVSLFPVRSIIKATSATICFFDVDARFESKYKTESRAKLAEAEALLANIDAVDEENKSKIQQDVERAKAELASFNPDPDPISYEVKDMEFRFKNGNIGLRNINLAEREGKLIGIMGASGAGKTTLLNVLCGNEKPSKGEVLINGLNLHTESDKLEGVIGLIPQDDLLIEELTVYENLYYSAKLCFRNKTDEEIKKLVDVTLDNLGLYERRNLPVGSPLSKSISGGQRKRLNIALELIREPAILFVDEPTSGLSSGDSENVINLLRELAVKNGKLVFVVIHQPSSDIYKMFDKMFILDTGGYPVYYGDPVGAVSYTKRIAKAGSDQGACSECGNVNTELVFNILEAKVIDDWGGISNKRKKKPEAWHEDYNKNIVLPQVESVKDNPPSSLDLPSWFGQFCIYARRDFWAKISNTQYILLNILEAPFLGFVLAYLIRYIVDPDSDIYIFRENENIPIYIFMGIIVSIFFGLIISAEEIFKDAKIMKRERFLNLSRSAYLMSKILILMGISAIQMILFIIVGNAVIGFQGMNTEFFLMLFSVSVSSNILGLIISSTFNTIVTIYIMIPLLMIPQMVLGGAMFTFDKLNKDITSVDKVPFVAEFIPARYAYEGLIVHQFKHNKFKQKLFDVEMNESMADFKQVYYLPELQKALDNVKKLYDKNDIENPSMQKDLALLANELGKENKRQPQIEFSALASLTPEAFNTDVYYQTTEYIEQLMSVYNDVFMEANGKRERVTQHLLDTQAELYNAIKDAYYNETVSDVVRKTFDKNKILRDGDKLIQIVDPIYQVPEPEGLLPFRSQFFAPCKYCFGTYWDTLWFNIACIWILTCVLYAVLYYDLSHRGFEYLGVKFEALAKKYKQNKENRKLKKVQEKES